MAIDTKDLTLKRAVDMLSKKEMSATELTNSYIERIEENNDSTNAFITKTFDRALEQARESDKRIASGNARSLEGIPMGIKDLFCTKDVLTTSCSKMLSNFIPPYESTVTQRLWKEGAIMLGKTNMDEFAMGSSNETSYYGPCINTFKDLSNPEKQIVPGGSSGGSAVAVSGNMCLASLGSDTGGSVRQPAAFCNIVGVRPTYGTCSRYGMIAFASSLDQAGVFAKNVEDAAIVLEKIAGKDVNDVTTLSRESYDFTSDINKDIKGMKIGIPRDFMTNDVDKEILDNWQEQIKVLESLGCEMIDISLPRVKNGIDTYYILASAQASSNLARYDGIRYGLRVKKEGDSLEDIYLNTRTQNFGKEVKRRIMLGTYVLSAGSYEDYFLKAMRVSSLIRNDFQEVFKKVDAIFNPTVPHVPFGVGEILDPVKMYLNDVFTVLVNLGGVCGTSIPSGLNKNGLPIGMQIICNSFEDAKMLRIANALFKINKN